MPFHANEAAEAGKLKAHRKLVSRLAHQDQEAATACIDTVIEQWGPVIDGYPNWHPFVSGLSTPTGVPRITGLDHTIYFRNAILTCPYKARVEDVYNSVRDFSPVYDADIDIQELETTLYNAQAVPLLITCEWDTVSADGSITKARAVARMVEEEIRHRHQSDVGETWQKMQPYILGVPHGSRSSLFVNENTGQAMKTVWNALVEKGEVFGPVFHESW